MNDPQYILLYDGVCGFCNSTVQLIIRHDRTKTMKFAPLQGTFAAGILERHPQLQGIDSLIIVENAHTPNETVRFRSDGALTVAAYLGGWWNLFRAAGIFPAPFRDAVYDIIAKYRYRLFGRYDSCPLPSPDVRSRFID